ncbi:AB hydrolase-1 domain-containing protein [Mycena indigotica]|uniref:AB hydrolase-1 domain-containing protein n=1 Tax=Mycena indigotica TaxID=2126181 RepID=A0A8H6T568_9AGAR|nr:AB hydrolase-1 domain-containing protein [Mycena indigotica]KAF7311968.1 AB hydrolase-1 domain-containing protein [Mycena indigotica]
MFKLFFTLVTLSNVLVWAQTTFDWNSLAPSPTLNWTPCYSGLQCALFQVPIDYTFRDKRNISIAVARYRATVPAKEYRGPIFFNPGGPANSGVESIVSSGAAFAEFLGAHFDIVGFDIRGIANSRPSISLFDTPAERASYLPDDLSIRMRPLDASDDTLTALWARMQLLGQRAQAYDKPQDYLKYFTTDYIATDMLRLTDAFGFPKLKYWGVSYGSILGQTFATLFPDKVERLVVDGKFASWAIWTARRGLEVCSVFLLLRDPWMTIFCPANLTGSMTDTDHVLQTFFDDCFKAGPSECAYYDSSPAKIAANLKALEERLRRQPISVLTPTSHGVVDYSFLRVLTFANLLGPSDWPNFARLLAQISAGNGTEAYTQKQVPTFQCSQKDVYTLFQATIGMACSDMRPVHDTIPELDAFRKNEAKLSGYGNVWANWRVWCSGWKIHREGKFTGPVGAKTSFPLLIIGNTFDPSTPHMWSQKVSTQFPGSVLLTNDGFGHTSLIAPSTCTHKALGAYFQNGTLPAKGTICPVDFELFPGIKSKQRRSEEDARLLRAISTIRKAVPDHVWW